MTRLKIKDVLLQMAENIASLGKEPSKQPDIDPDIIKSLPRLFPQPDEIFTQPLTDEYDILFIYRPRDEEVDESLRMSLSIAFPSIVWDCELVSLDNMAVLRGLVFLGRFRLLIKILGIDVTHYRLGDTTTQSSISTVYTVEGPSGFFPYTNERPDVHPEILFKATTDHQIASSLKIKQSYILSLLATAVPENAPVPQEATIGYGINYDVDLLYFEKDNDSCMRKYLDKRFGYAGWILSINKVDAARLMQTTHTLVAENGHTLRVRLTIVEPNYFKEKLFLMADFVDKVIFRAVRPKDPDYKEVCVAFGQSE